MARKAPQLDLSARKRPTQARGQRRVDLILDAVSTILVEKGFDGVTTGAIAKKAGIPVGSIYQFFPNKYAILKALSERHAKLFADMVARVVQSRAGSFSLDELVDAVYDGATKVMFSNRAVIVLWAGMQHSEEMRAADAQLHYDAAEYTRAALAPLLPNVGSERLEVVILVLVRVTSAALFQAAHEETSRRDQIVSELKRLVKAYLASVRVA